MEEKMPMQIFPLVGRELPVSLGKPGRMKGGVWLDVLVRIEKPVSM